MRAILTYHSIDDSGSPISCALEAFDRHVEWLTSGCVHVASLEELVGLPPEVDAVAITFDDAFRNFAEIAAPRLIAHGLPVTIFTVTGKVGATNAWDGVKTAVPDLPLLGWDALASLAARGIEIGSHTRTHCNLTQVAPSVVADEVRGSAEAIEARLGVRPTTFAYPYGCVDTVVADAVAATYKYACTTEFRTLDASVQPAWLPRLDAYYFQQPGILERWGTPVFDHFVRRRRTLRRLRRDAGLLARRMLGLRRQ